MPKIIFVCFHCLRQAGEEFHILSFEGFSTNKQCAICGKAGTKGKLFKVR